MTSISTKLDIFIQTLLWKILKKSTIFWHWYKHFLSELLYELSSIDLTYEETFTKYHNKYKDVLTKLDGNGRRK